MPRVRKGAARTQARKKLLRLARGFYGARSKHKWKAKVGLVKAGVYKYRHRRLIKRDMRALWITRLTAACKMRGTRYSTFINGLRLSGILLNRKMLSELAIHDTKAFDHICETAIKAAKVGSGKNGIKTGIEFGEVPKGGSATAVKPAAKPAAKPAPAGAKAAAPGSSNDIEDIEGIGPAMAKKLAPLGIKTISDLREHGKTAAAREQIATKSDIKSENIHKWTFASDFFRLSGMDGDQAELLVANGVKTVPALAKQDGASLAKKLAAGNTDAAGKSIAPRTPDAAEVSGWIAQAKGLPAVVTE
jgi:large subunit ribosomal protein L20